MKTNDSISMTQQEKQRQIRKEALATAALFLLCAAWHIGFGFGLNGCEVRWLGFPLWWWISTPGVFVLAVAGVCILLHRVFRNFDLGSEEEEEG